MGAVDQPRVDHDDVARGHGHVDLVRVRGEGGVVWVAHLGEGQVVRVNQLV